MVKENDFSYNFREILGGWIDKLFNLYNMYTLNPNSSNSKDMEQNPLELQNNSEKAMEKQTEKPLGVPDTNYTPPFMMTSRKANKKVASHLDFLRQLTSIK